MAYPGVNQFMMAHVFAVVIAELPAIVSSTSGVGYPADRNALKFPRKVFDTRSSSQQTAAARDSESRYEYRELYTKVRYVYTTREL
jgi:hypothetical protein